MSGNHPKGLGHSSNTHQPFNAMVFGIGENMYVGGPLPCPIAMSPKKPLELYCIPGLLRLSHRP